MEQVLDEAGRRSLDIQWILETHAHADHLTAADQLRRRTGARIACGRGICRVQEIFAPVYDMGGMPTDGSQFDRLLAEGDQVVLGDSVIDVLDTPGHTNDSVTYVVDGAAFIGDTLFTPSFGTARCDFPGGDAGLLFDSIQKIYALPEETVLYLCHDYPKGDAEPVASVPLSRMKRENMHLSADTQREAFVKMRTARDAQLGLPRLILPSLQINILAGAMPAAGENGVHYLNMPFNQALSTLIQAGVAGQRGDEE
jgi:glyoxylase-like metal-dependent hydrolase (beta-lactamase superfamily II)